MTTMHLNCELRELRRILAEPSTTSVNLDNDLYKFIEEELRSIKTPIYCKTKTVEEEEEVKKENSSIVRKVFDFVPVIGPILEFRDGVKNIKKGNIVSGWFGLVSGIVDFGHDVCSLLSFATNTGLYIIYILVKKIIKRAIKSRVTKYIKRQCKGICINIVKTAVKRKFASTPVSYAMKPMNKPDPNDPFCSDL